MNVHMRFGWWLGCTPTLAARASAMTSHDHPVRPPPHTYASRWRRVAYYFLWRSVFITFDRRFAPLLNKLGRFLGSKIAPALPYRLNRTAQLIFAAFIEHKAEGNVRVSLQKRTTTHHDIYHYHHHPVLLSGIPKWFEQPQPPSFSHLKVGSRSSPHVNDGPA